VRLRSFLTACLRARLRNRAATSEGASSDFGATTLGGAETEACEALDAPIRRDLTRHVSYANMGM